MDWFIGYLKNEQKIPRNEVYIRDFEWQCGWYWSGGWVGNENLHCHFDGCFLQVPDYRGHPLGDFSPSVLTNGAAVWEPLGCFLDEPQYDAQEWWRIKDLFKQFYALVKAAEVFKLGGHCTPSGRTEAEIDPEKAALLNKHIETVIIPEIRKALNKES